MIYLDWNATAPLHPAARAAMEEWLGVPANPHAQHALGRAAAAAVDRARAAVAARLDWPRDGVVFTGSATEANATVLAHGRWLVSAVEHPSVRAWGAETVGVDAEGRVDVGALADRLARGGVDGVSVMLANNETGVLQPVEEVAAVCRRAGVGFHCDASQGPGRVEVALPAAWVTVSAHKLGGPTGVGALLVPRGAPARPLVRGGPQERGWRAGTHAVPAIVGFGAAAAAARPMVSTWRDAFEAGLRALGGRVAGAGAERLPNTTAVAFEGVEAADLVMALDLEGFAVSAGAACASGSAEPSPVLRAMGFAGSAVRVSVGPTTPLDAADALLGALARVLARARGEDAGTG